VLTGEFDVTPRDAETLAAETVTTESYFNATCFFCCIENLKKRCSSSTAKYIANFDSQQVDNERNFIGLF